MGFFSSKKTTYDPMSAYTPEQRASIQALMSLASTGSGGGINLGEAYGGALGSYDSSGMQTAYDQLMSLYGGSELSTASDTYTRMANNKFNPDDPSSGYASFSRALAKAGDVSSSALDRESAITGNRFGTSIGRDKASLGADMQNQRGMFLADLFNQGENRALQGAAGLQSLTGLKGNLAEAGSQQAGLINAMKDAQAKDALDEYKRQREETLSRIGLMQDQWATPMGSITTKSPSMFSSIASPLFGAIGTAIGGPVGGGIGSAVGSLFGGGSSTSGGGSTGGFNLSSLFSGLFGGGTVGNTGMTQSQILGTNTRRWS
jgi:hypothetical protein